MISRRRSPTSLSFCSKTSDSAAYRPRIWLETLFAIFTYFKIVKQFKKKGEVAHTESWHPLQLIYYQYLLTISRIISKRSLKHVNFCSGQKWVSLADSSGEQYLPGRWPRLVEHDIHSRALQQPLFSALSFRQRKDTWRPRHFEMRCGMGLRTLVLNMCPVSAKRIQERSHGAFSAWFLCP